MGQTCKIIAYRIFHSTALAAKTKPTKWRRCLSSPTELRWSQSDLNVKTMEKDKLFVLDVCGAYGHEDIYKLDRSEMNKPARGIG